MNQNNLPEINWGGKPVNPVPCGEWKFVNNGFPGRSGMFVTSAPIIAHSEHKGWWVDKDGNKRFWTGEKMTVDWSKAETKHSG